MRRLISRFRFLRIEFFKLIDKFRFMLIKLLIGRSIIVLANIPFHTGIGDSHEASEKLCVVPSTWLCRQRPNKDIIIIGRGD